MSFGDHFAGFGDHQALVLDLGAVCGGTTGSIPFFDSAGCLTQDNANLFWDDASNRLGIGNNAPTQDLDITGNAVISGTLALTALTQGSVIFVGASGVLTEDNTNLFFDDALNTLRTSILNLTADSNQIVLDSDDGSGFTTTLTDSATAARVLTFPDTTAGLVPDNGDILTGVWDFGGATSLEIPNSAAPTVNAAGEIAIDTVVANHTGKIKYFDGTEELTVIDLPTANLLSTDRFVIVYNATNDEFEMLLAPIHTNVLQFAFGDLGLGGANDPGMVLIGGQALTFSFDAGSDKEVFATCVLPLAYDDGTDLNVRFIWSPLDASAGNVIWAIEFVVVEPNNGELVTAATTTQTVTDATNSTQDELLETANITITGTGFTSGETIIMRLFRNGAAGGDTYGDKANLHVVAIEYTADDFGA